MTGAVQQPAVTGGSLFPPGAMLGDLYKIRALLGAGGMGEVYEALDCTLGRRVAIKIAHADIDPEYLLREGRALAAIRHPGVVTVHAMGQHAGMSFLVLEHIQGLSLDRMIVDRQSRRERFPVLEAIDLLVPVADALAVVHQAGLAHRDVKPANVMLAPAGRVVLMDFGLVVPHADRIGNRIVAGSLPYMAPEALTGEVGDGAAALVDVYAMGILAYELLTGTQPFQGREPFEVYHAKTTRPALPLSAFRADVPDGFAELIARMMANDASERPNGAEEVLWELRALRRQIEAEGRIKPLSVLIVDDDPEMLEVLTLLVRGAAPDAEIETTEEGRRAVHSVRRRVPDLLLLDLDLPDINGIEVCMLLRGMKLGDACMIVSVSGRATPADVELLQQLGVQSLQKGPHLSAELRRLVERLRPRKRLGR
ncbi:MAG TPA: serine/threonine-protein kinase [Polyangiaceae bacterium]|nr:serine/threonine-protein kinase [Polyangiaceae bacterium]